MIERIIHALLRLVLGADAVHQRKVKRARAAAKAARVAAFEAEARARAGRQGADK